MRNLIAIAFVCTCLFSFGQSQMFWNNYSNFNPAMSGFEYEQHASLTYTDAFPALTSGYSDLYGNVNSLIANRHGLGINYTGSFSPSLTSHKVFANYNYQFDLKKAGKLAIGTGVGYGHYDVVNNSNTPPTGPGNPIPNSQETSAAFELNIGMAYKWKNFILGFSGTNLTPPKGPLISFTIPRSKYNFHAQYTANIGENFHLTPRVLYSFEGGFHQLQPNLTVTYLDKFSLGVSSQFRDNYGVNIGWDIKNKFRVAYLFSKTFSKLNNAVSGGTHEFSIGYVLKNN